MDTELSGMTIAIVESMKLTISQRADGMWIARNPYNGSVLATAGTRESLIAKLSAMGI